MSDSIKGKSKRDVAKVQKNLDEMLLIRTEKDRPGNTIPDCIEYEGKLLDTSKLIDGLCIIFERQIAQSGGVK